MKLYHATMRLDIIDEFTPRIPENRFKGEEEKTPRVCLASSIKGCLTAAPFGGSQLGENIDLAGDYNKLITRLIRIYEFDTALIDKDNIISPEYLYQNDIVRDAEVTGEHWITVPIKPTKSYIIKLTRYCDQYCEDDIAYEYVKLYENGEIEDISEYLEGSITVIDDIKYEIIPEERRSKVIKLNSVIKYEDGYEGNEFLQYIYNLFPFYAKTNLDVEYRNGIPYLIGEIDTRSAEIDILDLTDVINDTIPAWCQIA